jgi:hypothetical protein
LYNAESYFMQFGTDFVSIKVCGIAHLI